MTPDSFTVLTPMSLVALLDNLNISGVARRKNMIPIMTDMMILSKPVTLMPFSSHRLSMTMTSGFSGSIVCLSSFPNMSALVFYSGLNQLNLILR